MKKILIAASLFIISINAFAHVEPGIDGRNAGDIIAVRTDTEIAAWCDFSKQIVLAMPNTLCVYNGNKK